MEDNMLVGKNEMSGGAEMIGRWKLEIRRSKARG
jgi:hypothetical protein